jgi:hypothetical protein
MSFRLHLYLIGYNIKLLANKNLAAALLLVCALLFFTDLNNIPAVGLAQIGERYLSIIGILLITQIGCLEGDKGAAEVSAVRRYPQVLLFLQRLFFVTLVMVLMISGFMVAAKLQKGMFSYWQMTWGIIITSSFLGLFGLTVASLTGNIVSGYLVSFSYLIFEMLSGGKYTKSFYLLSLLRNSFGEKYNILVLIGCLLIVNILFVILSVRK